MKASDFANRYNGKYSVAKKPDRLPRQTARVLTPKEKFLNSISVQERLAEGEAIRNPKNKGKAYKSWFSESGGELRVAPKYGVRQVFEYDDGELKYIVVPTKRQEYLSDLKRAVEDGALDQRLEELEAAAKADAAARQSAK